MNFFKLNPSAKIPAYQTRFSAGFDLHACLDGNVEVKAFNLNNREITVPVRQVEGKSTLVMSPGIRYLIPTGLIVEIEKSNLGLFLYPRSGMALKKGLNLSNCVGVIDCDYVEELFIPLVNTSDVTVVVTQGDRVAQGVIHNIHHGHLLETKERPLAKSERSGGFGSTGEN